MQVEHDEARCRFTLLLPGAGEPAALEYAMTRDGAAYNLLHTYVPPEARGRGVAALLVRRACEVARENGCAIVPSCSYVGVYMRRNPHDADLVGVAGGRGA